MRLMDLGDMCSGRVVDEDTWSGDRLPLPVRPKQYASGRVVGINANYPELVTIQTYDGRKVMIRRG
jgi:hypothetical protein